MSQPMLSLQPAEASGETSKATAHLLPCRIQHDGSVGPVESFWAPQVQEDGTKTAYFRGRKLQGKAVKLPEGYRGVVAATSTSEPPSSDVVDVEAESPPQGVLQAQAELDEMVIWAHETAVDASADPYLRGVEEWIAVAEKIHSYKK